MTDAFRQPLLHDETVVLRAPAQAWSAADGSMGARAIHGLFVSDVRVISELAVEVGGAAGEPIATLPEGASAVSFVSLLRHLDGAGADPRVRLLHRRVVSASGASETLTLQSAVATPIETSVLVRLASDLAGMDAVKAGRAGPGAEIETTTGGATWSGGAVSASLTAPGAKLAGGTNLELRWDVTIPAGGEVSVGWSVDATDVHAVVAASTTEPDWVLPQLPATDERVGRWVERAVDDLRALRMTTVADPASTFLGAGAPWFFTLFGRDALWAARFLLPLGTETAGGTLRVLAALQGTTSNPNTAEQPGKIMHELRRGTLSIENDIELPPLYYGTVDATALWICLLHDAWRAGLPDAEVRALLPNLTAALAWMRDYGDADGDGLLEYIDESGRGLANQGWKDSGDSVQWKDGRLATGPIALCEVQAYAYEAAMHGADLLEHFGEHGDEWRSWAGALQERFRASFWIDDPDGAYPAIALDADKRAVDSLTSNIGHLLGTGILNEAESKLVADRLSSPELNSGYGLRTMATSSAGYWPLSYHGGSVWTHDTAIAIAGLTRAGFREQAAPLIEGLLAAASAFDYRMPELHSGDPATAAGRPVPYPAACRPQAWSAAAAISVLASILAP